MNRIRNNEWQNDEELQSSIKHYVMQNMKRSEVLDFLKRDYPEYAWSLPMLDRRIRYFDIKYINYETTVDEVVAASNTENIKMMVLDNSLAIAPCTKSFVNSMGLQFLMLFFPNST